MCLQVIQRCAAYAEFEDAITCFLEHAVPAMGEAYWRAYSVITANYAESGGKQYTESSLIERRIFSRKNPDAKKPEKPRGENAFSGTVQTRRTGNPSSVLSKIHVRRAAKDAESTTELAE